MVTEGFLRRRRRPSRPVASRCIHIVDLFAGAGGMTLGLAEAGCLNGLPVEIALAMDDDPVAAAVFDGNFSPRVLLSHRVESLFQGQLGSPLSMRENAARAKFAQV